jgi:uncharacterized membrane protein
MASIIESIELEVPVRTAYNQWTQFEEFPTFMDGVERIEQLDDTHIRWHGEIGGTDEQWESEITEQEPDQRIAWKTTAGNGPEGVVTFHRLEDQRSRVTVQMEYEPEGVTESVGSALGFDSRRVKGDLERFKELLEERGVETGAWRGEVKQENVTG